MDEQHERRFLVKGNHAAWTGINAPFSISEIRQGYLSAPGEDRELRIRAERRTDVPDAGTVFTTSDPTVVAHMTVKSGHGLSRERSDPEIPSELFDELWPQTEGRRIEKLRTEYEVLTSGHQGQVTLVVDEFGGHLTPLVLAEFKFTSREYAEAFHPPTFVGTEVTDDRRFENASLAGLDAPPEPER